MTNYILNDAHDTQYIQAVKSDLITQISAKFGADEETGFTIDKNGFFSKDYEARF